MFFLIFILRQPAGCKAGTFDPYPSHSADPYKMKIHRPVNVVNKSGKIFTPSQGPKTTPSVSIVDQNVMRYGYFFTSEQILSFAPCSNPIQTFQYRVTSLFCMCYPH